MRRLFPLHADRPLEAPGLTEALAFPPAEVDGFAHRTPADLLEADGILRVVAHAEIDPDAAAFVLEDAAERVLDLLRPALVTDKWNAGARVDWEALRAAAQLLGSALIVNQTARACRDAE